MKQMIVRYKTDDRGFPTNNGMVKLRPEMLTMDEYRDMTRQALEALERAKRGRLPIEIHRKRKGPKLYIDMDNGSTGIYITRDLMTAARHDDEITIKRLAAVALLAVRALAKEHFPELLLETN